jgi:hypothetical protein
MNKYFEILTGIIAGKIRCKVNHIVESGAHQ